MEKVIIKDGNTLLYRVSFWGLLALTVVMYVPVLKHFPLADSWIFLEPRDFAETISYFVRSILPEEWDALWLRPVPMFTFWLDTLFLSDSFWWPHLNNILWHLANTALIWHLVSRSLADSSGRYPLLPSFAAGLLYAVHPLAVGSVAWIAARFDLMCVTFGLAAISLWFSWNDAPSRNIRLVGCLILLMGSLLSKEQGVVFSGTVILSALCGAHTNRSRRRILLSAAGLVVVLITVYLAWRITVFHGLGGYGSRQGRPPNIINPFAYLTTFSFPYLNPAPQWQYNLFPVLTTILAGIVSVSIYKTSKVTTSHPCPQKLIVFASVLLLGLGTTIPHSNFQFREVLDHLGARYAMIGLSGFALTIGWLLGAVIRNNKIHKIAIVLYTVWMVSFLWRSDMQIAVWRHASETATYIVERTVDLAPDPPHGAGLFYLDVPPFSRQHAPILLVGLKEAIIRRYNGRNDLRVFPRATQRDLIWADPIHDRVFLYDRINWTMDRLQPQEQ